MAAAYPPGPPITPIPTEEEYDMIIDDLVRDGWTTNWNIDYNWGNGIPPPLFHQDAGTEYEIVRKPDSKWLLFSRRTPHPDPPPPIINPGQGGPPIINPNPGQGGRKRHKQKKSKKNKHSRKRRRTRKHK